MPYSWKTTDWLVSIARVIPSITIGAIVAGCQVGPNFRSPGDGKVPSEFHQTSIVSSEDEPIRGHVDVDQWWGYFDDPVLHQLIHDTNSHNLDLKEAAWRIAESRSRAGLAKSQFFPQVNASVGATRRNISENASQFALNNDGSGAFPYYANGLDSTWEIDLFGKLARGYESALADNWAQVEARHALKVTLLAEVATTYVQARVLQQRLNIARQNLALQNQTLSIVEARQAAGLVGQLDQSEAESNVAVTTASIPPVQQELQTSLYQISVLIGQTPDGRIELSNNSGVLPLLILDKIEPGMPAELLSRRPDIRKAYFDAKSANALIGVAVAERLPQLSIRGDISLEARGVSMVYSDNSVVTTLGPSLRWNILNFKRLKRNIEVREARYQQSVLAYQSTVLKALQEVESSLVEYYRQKERVLELRKVAEVTNRSVDISLVRYEQNLITFDRVLDAQRGLAVAQSNVATAEGDVLLAVIKIFKSLGGGWKLKSDYSVDLLCMLESDKLADNEYVGIVTSVKPAEGEDLDGNLGVVSQ